MRMENLIEAEEAVTSFQTNDEGSGPASIPVFQSPATNPEAFGSLLKAPQAFEDTDAFSPPDKVHCLPAMFLNDDGSEGAFGRASNTEMVPCAGVESSSDKDAGSDHLMQLDETELKQSEDLDIFGVPPHSSISDFPSHLESDRRSPEVSEILEAKLSQRPEASAPVVNNSAVDSSNNSAVDSSVEFFASNVESQDHLHQGMNLHKQDANKEADHKLHISDDASLQLTPSESPNVSETTDKLSQLNQVACPVRPSHSERSHDRSKRPGVILLGRGNSFSLGRSEVILLHGSSGLRRRNGADKNSNKSKSFINRFSSTNLANGGSGENKSNGDSVLSEPESIRGGENSIENKSDFSLNGAAASGFEKTGSEKTELSSHPPAISNLNKQPVSSDNSHRTTPREIRIAAFSPGHLTNGLGSKSGEKNGNGILSPGCHFDTTTYLDEELEQLWRKAEGIMFQKRSVVEKVLEDFGISNVGGEADTEGRGGDGCSEADFDVDDEEESVWQAVQNNFRV